MGRFFSPLLCIVELKSGCKRLLFEQMLCICEMSSLNRLFQAMWNWLLFCQEWIWRVGGLGHSPVFSPVQWVRRSRGCRPLQTQNRECSRIPIFKCAGMYWQCAKWTNRHKLRHLSAVVYFDLQREVLSNHCRPVLVEIDCFMQKGLVAACCWAISVAELSTFFFSSWMRFTAGVLEKLSCTFLGSGIVLDL